MTSIETGGFETEDLFQESDLYFTLEKMILLYTEIGDYPSIHRQWLLPMFYGKHPLFG